VTAAAFGQRRKMLRVSLKQIVANPDELLRVAGIAPDVRAEQVPVEGFATLALAYAGSAARS
jgi:16S rRNA (adenine1518-N6/adenine1519-N6)-dimethyltransferase